MIRVAKVKGRERFVLRRDGVAACRRFPGLYTAMSRATHQLVLLHPGQTPA